jgi:hypothetical protein
MALPATGGTWEVELEPSLNPLAVRYWQVTHVLIRDYFKTDGTVFNLADPSVGLGTQGVFTPFAADNVSIRSDLLITSPGTNQGFYSLGLLKEDAISTDPSQSIQETPTSQYVRTVRNVLTKLDDKVTFTPIESSPLVDALNFELPLANGLQAVGTPGYQSLRGQTDQLVERIIVLIGIDTDNQLLAKVYPRVVNDKKGKLSLERKNPESGELTYCVEPDPYSKQSMWLCRAGSQWLSEGDFDFLTTAPIVTPLTLGVTATVTFPTPLDITSPTYTVAVQDTPTSSFTSGTAGSPTVSGAFTSLTLSGLTAATEINAVQVTATGTVDSDSVTATSPVSAPFTTLAA